LGVTGTAEVMIMDVDTEKIDAAVLAVLAVQRCENKYSGWLETLGDGVQVAYKGR
jgi:hypothetical protein